MRTLVATLAWGDLRNILRDSTLVLVLVGPLALVALLFALPYLEALSMQALGFDLSHYRLLIFCFLSVVPGMLFGLIYGFIILDERDEQIIEFISITPLTRQGYLTYKLHMPMMLSSGAFLLILYGTSLIELAPGRGVLIAVMVGTQAAMGTLFLVSYADNKVEGLAFSKLLGVAFLAIPVVFLWHSPWQWLASFLPPFWVAKSLIADQAGSAGVWFFLLGGMGVHFLVLMLFMRKFLNRQD